ncbi:hypothetical protein JL720_2390 [Aureococcus anophagefferens]|nr:hypothetical protein JL720_2390 [Aureococcus anophagefferens]
MSFNHHQRLRLTLTDGDATIACNVAQKLNVTLRGLGIGGVVRLTNYLLNTIKGEQVVILLGAELVAPPRAVAPPRRPPRAVAPPPRVETRGPRPIVVPRPVAAPAKPAAPAAEVDDEPPAVTPGVFVTSGSRKLVCPSEAALKKASKLMNDARAAKPAAAKPKGPRPIRVPKRVGPPKPAPAPQQRRRPRAAAPAVLTNRAADFADGADPSAVVAADDATFAKVATARLRLTRSAASGERSATLVTGARDDFGDLPSSHFAVTAAGVADAGEPGDWMADVG